MTPLVEWLLNSIPYVLQLVVGVVGLIVTVSTRHRGRGTALLVTAFALMMASYLGWVVWGWVEAHGPSFIRDYSLSFETWQAVALTGNIVLGLVEVAAWVMVVLGVLRSRGRPAQAVGQPPVGQPGPFSPPPPPGPGAPA